MTINQLNAAVQTCIGQGGSQNQQFNLGVVLNRFIRALLTRTAQAVPGVPSITAPVYFDAADDLINCLTAMTDPANGYKLTISIKVKNLLVAFIKRNARKLSDGTLVYTS